MLRPTCHILLALAVVLTASAMFCPTTSAGGLAAGNGRSGSRYAVAERQIDTHNPELFYNYYVPPNFGGVGAQLYMAPGPVPGHVGHTYYTYQPLYPHEYLYGHTRTYHRYYNCGKGLNRTKVQWLAPPRIHDNALLNIFRLPR